MDVSSAPVEKYMTRAPLTIAPQKLAVEALALMRERQFDELPVVDAQGRVAGLLDVQDLLAAGLV
jgi:arabinose-5-phosphate isomerase